MDEIIKGVTLTKLRVIKGPKGSIIKLLDSSSEILKKSKEIYFSTIYFNKIKGWNLHKKMTVNLACIVGKIKIILYDNRKNSKTYKTINKFKLSKKKLFLLTIPPNIWFSFKNEDVKKKECVLINCASIKHDSKEYLKKAINNKDIPYKW